MKFLPLLGALLLVILPDHIALTDDVDRYIADLKDQSGNIRADAAKALGMLNDTKAGNLCFSCLMPKLLRRKLLLQ
jgi:hypothetical protein